jgi:class 3 adenylate cyclase/tetratricopeptide (TPR) repeat protein
VCGTALTGGAPATASATAAPAAAPAAVRKTVTVLFADLGGSTGFGERKDAEIARQVLARYHALLQETIDAHGGTVAKFMGDGMMATWGIPEISEDDARRAVAAGADLQVRFEKLARDIEDRHGELLSLRVGINTGEVVIGEGDADIIGDALNVAARLEKACRPGHVLVGEETWRLTRGDFGYEALGEVTVAGRAQPVATYEVAAEAEAEQEVAAPFVGRDAEMQRLVGVFDDARQSTTARLTTVLGSPGVGKTRLSRELCARLAEHGNAQSVELRCDRAGEATFAPVAQLIRDASGLTDDLDADAARAAIGALLTEDESDHTRVVDVLAGLVGVGPARSVEETFWGVRRLVEATAATRPLVVVIDDIQWAEPLLLDLIEHLAEWVADAAVLVVGLARPELREVRPSLAEPGRPVSAVVVLDGLDASATEALAAGLLGTERLPADLVERLPASTDGNPLFVRELVRMLVDDRIIRRREDGAWELTIDADAVDVPPTIQSLLGARVERLPAGERELLELASVVGAEFSLGALRELAGDGVAIPALLEAMRRKELVEPTGTYWGDEPVHRFHHVLIRDAAYRRLLKTTRADVHERVAVWTDRTAADLVGEHEAATAFHYEQAFRYRTELGTVDEDTARLGRRAAELLTVAAQRALGRDDLASAGALSARALALLPASDAAARADLLQTACECLLASGAGAAAAPLVEELGRSATGDVRLAAWAECYAAQLVGLTDPEGLVAADERAQAAAAVLTELGDGSGQAKAHQVRAMLLARLGRVGDAELELDLALAAAREADDRRRVTAVLGAAPDAALFGPSPVARAGGRCLDVVRLLRITTASPAVEAASNRCQAVLESLRGRFDVSRSMLASARAALEELGLRHGIAQTELYAGMVELIAGDPHAAIPPLRAAYEGLGTLGVGADAGQAAALLALALLAEGAVDEAERMATASEQLAGQNLKTAIGWRVARAEVLAARGDVAGAVALAEQAVEIAAGTDLVIDHADACVALAALRAQAGDATGARAARTEAKRLYDQKGATVPAERLDASDSAKPDAEPAPAVEAPDSNDGTRRSTPANAASDLFGRIAARFSEGRFDECGALCAEDIRVFDHRPVIGTDLIGRAAVVANFEATAALGSGSVAFEPIAVRGSTLALGRTVMDFGDWGSAFLMLGELGPDGLGARGGWFDEADLTTAIDELDAWYLAGEGAEHADLAWVAARWTAAANRSDFDALRELAAPGFRFVDRRQLGAGTVDLDGMIEWFGQYVDLDGKQYLVDTRFRGRAIIATAVNRAVGSDGGEFAWSYHSVGVVTPEGRTKWIELFDEADWDAALARFDELSATDPRHPRVENVSTRANARWFPLTFAGGFDEARALLVPDYRLEDRRRTVSVAPVADRDAAIDFMRASLDVGFVEVAIEPIAVRGECLSLNRMVMRDGDGNEVPFLFLTGHTPDGIGVSGVAFDEDDLAAATTELNDRHVVGEGAEHADVLRVVDDLSRHHAARDWTGLRDLIAEATTLVDHRRLGWPSGGRDVVIRMFQELVEMVPDHRLLFRKQHIVGRAVLTTLDSLGTTRDGGAYEWGLHSISTVDTAGRIMAFELFAEDDWETALARLDDLGAASVDARHPRVENAATRASQRVIDLTAAGRFDEATALFRPEFERHDRRRTVAGPPITGAVGYMESFRAILEQFDAITIEPIAVRGERLHLSRTRFATESGFETVFWHIAELDADGLIRWIASHDEEDLAAAVDELDDRYLAGEGAPDARVLSVVRAAFRALRDEDSDTLGPLLSPQLVTVDHQRIGFGTTTDRASFLERERSDQTVLRHDREYSRKGFVSGDAVLVVYESQRLDQHGGEVLYQSHFVGRVDGSDRIDRMEWFDLDDWGAALARFDELAAPTPDARTLELENAAIRVGRTGLHLAITGRWNELGALLHPDLARTDRRRTVSAPPTQGVDAYLDALAWMTQFDSDRSEPLAARGVRSGVYRAVFADGGGNEVSMIIALLVDEDGLAVRQANFDDDADGEIAAIDQIEEWHIAVEGAPDAGDLSVSREGMRGYHARDWDALRAATTEDFQLVDHRPLGWPLADADGWIRLMRERVAQVPDMRCAVRKMWWCNRVGLSLIEVMGTDPGGGRFSWPSLQISGPLSPDGRNPRIEYFPVDDVDAAFARFDELGAEAPMEPAAGVALTNAAMRSLEAAREFSSAPDRDVDDFAVRWLENRATAAGRRAREAAVRGDRAALLDAFAPDFARMEHRPRAISGDRVVGRELYVDGMLAGPDAGLTEFDATTLEIAGDDHGLGQVRWHNGDGFAQEWLLVYEADETGRLRRIANFDPEDRAAASALMHRWASERGRTERAP